MNGEVKEAKRELSSMKAKAIVDMALAIGIWIAVAYTWGILQPFWGPLGFYMQRNAITAFICLIILGAYLLGTGIEILRWKRKIASALDTVLDK